MINAEDTEDQPTLRNLQGCREVCNARIEAQADMLYARLRLKAWELEPGAMIVMHQGGDRKLGGQLLRAAGRVETKARALTADDANRFPGLWRATQTWYKRWPTTVDELSGEQIILYELKIGRAHV